MIQGFASRIAKGEYALSLALLKWTVDQLVFREVGTALRCGSDFDEDRDALLAEALPLRRLDVSECTKKLRLLAAACVPENPRYEAFIDPCLSFMGSGIDGIGIVGGKIVSSPCGSDEVGASSSQSNRSH